MAYKYLPLLWQSNLVSVPKCHVFREWEDIAWQTGEPVTRAELVETDWSNGYLSRLHWLKDGPFEAVATYHNGNPDHGLVHIPILWRGSFQKPNDIAWVRQDMEKVLLEDERWNKLPRGQALGDYCPGMVIFLSGPRRRCGGAAELVAELDESGACGNTGHHRCPGPGGPGHDPPGFTMVDLSPVSWRRAPERPERYQGNRGFPGQARLPHRQREAGIPGHRRALPG